MVNNINKLTQMIRMTKYGKLTHSSSNVFGPWQGPPKTIPAPKHFQTHQLIILDLSFKPQVNRIKEKKLQRKQ